MIKLQRKIKADSDSNYIPPYPFKAMIQCVSAKDGNKSGKKNKRLARNRKTSRKKQQMEVGRAVCQIQLYSRGGKKSQFAFDKYVNTQTSI